VSGPDGGGLRVLIVEDERDLGRVLAEYVEARGDRADVVVSAEAALDRLAAARPDAMILDVKLPGMSGLQLLQRPDVRDAGIAVIVVSGVATEEQARQCLRAGALEFLAKPVPLDVLGSVLDHVAVLVTPAAGPGRVERRLAARLPLTLPVRAAAEDGRTLHGDVVEVSTTGLRARFTDPLRTGGAVRLTLTLLDGGAPLELLALVVRAESDGSVAFWFLDATPAETERLIGRARQRPH
jgi:CheY-like chemotaxis protein